MDNLKTVRNAVKQLAEIEPLIDAGRVEAISVNYETNCPTDKKMARLKSILADLALRGASKPAPLNRPPVAQGDQE